MEIKNSSCSAFQKANLVMRQLLLHSLPYSRQDFRNEDGDVSVQVLSPFLICEHTESWVKRTHQVRWQNGSKSTPTASPDTNGTRSQNTGDSVHWLSEMLSLECQSASLFDALQKEGVLLVVCSSDNAPPDQSCCSSTWVLVHREPKAFSC